MLVTNHMKYAMQTLDETSECNLESNLITRPYPW